MSIRVHTRLVCDRPTDAVIRCGAAKERVTEGIVSGTIAGLREQARIAGWRRELRTMSDGETTYYVDLCPRCVRGMALVTDADADR